MKCQRDLTRCPYLYLKVLACPFVSAVGASYTILYNYLDFPAGVVPVTSVTEEDEEELKSFRGHFNDMWDKVFAKVCHHVVFGSNCFVVGIRSHYLVGKNPYCLVLSLQAIQGAVGLPVAVQCVALPWQDELCLRFMKEVEKLTQEKSNKN